MSPGWAFVPSWEGTGGGKQVSPDALGSLFEMPTCELSREKGWFTASQGCSGFLLSFFVYIRETCLSLKWNMCSRTGLPPRLVVGEAGEQFGSKVRPASAVLLYSCLPGYDFFSPNSGVL